MPLIEVDTSCELPSEEEKRALVKALSRLTAEGIGKPEQYLMACVRDNVAMSMSAEAGPCALVTVKSIGGLSQAVNQGLAERITQTLHDELGVPADRVYLTFTELAPTHWAWQGKTFG
jgi:phenylpyruvate tautomerase PptA (4-oxalocrotonate tautomerase family)